MKKDWKAYAMHIVECIEKIENMNARGDITQDVMLYDATLRNLQTMSEATRHLPNDKTSKYPDIPWKNISGFRNILVHDYLGDIDTEAIQDVIDKYISPLKIAVSRMLE